MEKVTAFHSSTPAWKIPQTEEPGRLQSMGLERVGTTEGTCKHTHTHTYRVDLECCVSFWCTAK